MGQYRIIQGDARTVLAGLRPGSSHLAITSPPYYAARKYDGDPCVWDDMTCQLGWEPETSQYVAHLVEVFEAVRRVLRDDGSLVVNIADSYSSGGRGPGAEGSKQRTNPGSTALEARRPPLGLKDGQLLGIPWRFAMAMQEAGWVLRSSIVWCKGASLQRELTRQVGQACLSAGLHKDQAKQVIEQFDPWVGNCMPESLNGWRFERHKIKIGDNGRGQETWRSGSNDIKPQQDHSGKNFKPSAEWMDCPGCPKCEKHNGFILRKGSWRPTRSHEYIYIFAKTDTYWSNLEAVREPSALATIERDKYTRVTKGKDKESPTFAVAHDHDFTSNTGGRNLRDSFVLSTKPFSAKKYGVKDIEHYAVYPIQLLDPFIKALCPDKACPICGAGYAPVIEGPPSPVVLNFWPTCDCKPCNGGDVTNADLTPIPGIMLDPFCGSGSSGVAALKNGRNFIGVDQSGPYCNLSRVRISKDIPGSVEDNNLGG